MDLSRRLAPLALRRVHVLPVLVPGWWATRAALGAAVTRRGWVLAAAPAEADALVVCGDAGPALDRNVQRVWDQLPAPRARAVLTERAAVTTVLDEVAGELADDTQQRSAASSRTEQTADPSTGAAADDGGHDGGMDHGGMDHGGMDHGGMDMAPSGIPLASGASDRDGLELDVLQVPLGPVLAHWPAGLVLHCTLAGDVVTAARTQLLSSGSPRPGDASSSAALDAARRLDAAGDVLALAGWPDVAAWALRLRDRLVVDATVEAASLVPEVARLRRRVARSSVLRWMLRGVGPVAGGLAPGPDVRDRLLALLDGASDLLRGAPPTPSEDPAHVIAMLPAAVTGLDVAAARLLVASLDLRTDRVSTQEVQHA